MSTLETTAEERSRWLNWSTYSYINDPAYKEDVPRLCRDVVALEAEVAALKRKLDAAAQLIKMRTADCATLKADNANHLKLNATLIYERDMARSDNADLRAEADHSANFAKSEAGARDRSEDRARQLEAELIAVVAERDRLKDQLNEDRLKRGVDALVDQRNKAEEERDKLKTALERLGSSEAFDVSRSIDAVRDRELLMRMDFARSALASNPSTEE